MVRSRALRGEASIACIQSLCDDGRAVMMHRLKRPPYTDQIFETRQAAIRPITAPRWSFPAQHNDFARRIFRKDAPQGAVPAEGLGLPGLSRRRQRARSAARRRPKDFDVATDATPGGGARAVQQQPADRPPFPAGACAFRPRDHRGGDVRSAPAPAAMTTAHVVHEDSGRDLSRQRLRRYRRRCVAPRFHGQRALLQHRGFLDSGRSRTAIDDLEAAQAETDRRSRTRYREDPVRMLRAARFAAKLDFEGCMPKRRRRRFRRWPA